MIPSAFVSLESLPLMANGKVDRRAMPAPEQRRPELNTDYVAPATPTEKELHNMWCDLLGLEQIDIKDNFFEHGGHSLMLTQLASRIRNTFHVEVPLRALFTEPSIGMMAACIEAKQIEQADAVEMGQMLREMGQLSPTEVRALLESEAI
jgi:acyl carrier protein